MWILWPQTYLLAAGTWLQLWTVQVTRSPGPKPTVGRGVMRMAGREESPMLSFYHPASLVPPLTYLDPQKVGHPPWGEPLWLQRLLGPPESVGPVDGGWGEGSDSVPPSCLAAPTWEPRVLFFALCGYLSNFRSQLKHHFSERLLGITLAQDVLSPSCNILHHPASSSPKYSVLPEIMSSLSSPSPMPPPCLKPPVSLA